ncbi:DNA replication/repair protein RecF [Dyella sp. KRB-257]|uniref:DNA replication/repair protein RecF n=1 Tax=Dyella sp. KRB-257 TaxID=3400915 RepID=UPI003C0375B2
MRVDKLRIQALRCLDDVTLEPAPGINVFVGANGAGKTSLLEAVFLLSHGRSFRSGARDALLQRGADTLSIYAELIRHGSTRRRLGLGREGSRWQGRLDGQGVRLSELVSECAVVSFDPGSHALIAAGAEERRRFLDWGVFHVEQDFLALWRRYQRALRQRNSLLRSGELANSLYLPWEQEMDDTAGVITAWREQYLAQWLMLVAQYVGQLIPELGNVTLRFRRGWGEGLTLGEALVAQRARDLGRGHTTQGAHRADWMVNYEHAPLREHLSRGQEKLTAVACLLAQAALFAKHAGEWPVVCIDDLASELDTAHQSALVAQLGDAEAQILVSGTDCPASLRSEARLFHVEQGRVSPLL